MKLTKGSKSSSQKKSAPVTATAKTQTASAASKPASQNGRTTGTGKAVTIEARIDVGFGNRLYLRGEGEGLSWNQGIPLTCVDSSTWKWTAPVNDKVKFKLLLNDTVWAQGEDLVAAPGQKVEISPAF
jgi:hypothetical protein